VFLSRNPEGQERIKYYIQNSEIFLKIASNSTIPSKAMLQD
jgi:hypothetical protein